MARRNISQEGWIKTKMTAGYLDSKGLQGASTPGLRYFNRDISDDDNSGHWEGTTYSSMGWEDEAPMRLGSSPQTKSSLADLPPHIRAIHLGSGRVSGNRKVEGYSPKTSRYSVASHDLQMQSHDSQIVMQLKQVDRSITKQETLGSVDIHAPDDLHHDTDRSRDYSHWSSKHVGDSKNSGPVSTSARLSNTSDGHVRESDIPTMKDHVSSTVSENIEDLTCDTNGSSMASESKRLAYAPHNVIERIAAAKAETAVEAKVEKKPDMIVTPAVKSTTLEQDMIGMVAAAPSKKSEAQASPNNPCSVVSDTVGSAVRAASMTSVAAISPSVVPNSPNDGMEGGLMADRRSSIKVYSFEDVQAAYAGKIHLANIPERILRSHLITFAEKHEVERIQRLQRGSLSQLSQSGVLSKSGVTEQSELKSSAIPCSTSVCISHPEYLLSDLDHYAVPELGSARMPLLNIGPLPKWESLWKQIERTLPPEIQAIPSPSYPFSKKRTQATKDPAATGETAVLPMNTNPRPNPLSAPALPTGRGAMRLEGCANSEFDEDLASNTFKIVEETAEGASRWNWFRKPAVSVIGDPAGRTLEFQLASMDENLEENNFGERQGYLWQESKYKQNKIFTWVCGQAANDLKCPVVLDVTQEGFTSGIQPTSGLRYNYQEMPSDIGYRPTRIHYGPIEWDKIPQPKLNDPFYLESGRFNQTSMSAMKTEATRLMKLLQETEIEEATKRRKRARRGSMMPTYENVDSSMVNYKNNPWVPRIKIYVRVARTSDALFVTRIYNHYTKHTIDAPEKIHVDIDGMKRRIKASRVEGYPFLVACQVFEHGDDPPRRGLLPPSYTFHGHEVVIGFARGRSWNGIGVNCFDDSALLEVFVSPQYTKEKVAANLLDRLIGCVDVDYASRQGVTINVEPGRPRWTHGWRQSYSHTMILYYNDVLDPSLVGRKKFLEDFFGFREVGAFADFCSKDGGRSRYNMLYMMRKANTLFSPRH